MPFTIQLEKVNKMGDYDEKYGQAYWGTVPQDKPVKFNSQNREISDGAVIEAEERTEKKSQKGTVYYQLRKVKLVERGVVGQYPETPQGTGQSPQIGFTEEDRKMLKEIHASVVGETIDAKDMLGGEEISLEDIPL